MCGSFRISLLNKNEKHKTASILIETDLISKSNQWKPVLIGIADDFENKNGKTVKNEKMSKVQMIVTWTYCIDSIMLIYTNHR